VLKDARLESRKEDGVYKRRKITFHSFRRFVRTTMSNQTGNSDYREWFLGHKKSVYYTNKPDDLKRIYKEQCMKYLTFLDYATVEATGRSFEAQLKQKDSVIEQLNQRIVKLEGHSEEIEEYRTIKPQFEELKRFFQEMQQDMSKCELFV
jgi:hypothetical protein